MKKDWLCQCGHSLEEHTSKYREEDGTMSEAVLICRHDKAYFKGMCLCLFYVPMTNLEYLEYLSDKE